MQLILTYASSPTSRAAFDARWEDRENAGLSLLQLWADADDPARMLALCEVAHRPRAEDWIARERALHGLAGATFVRTA